MTEPAPVSAPVPETADLVIDRCDVLTSTGPDGYRVDADRSLVMSDGVIVAVVSPAEAAGVRATERLDARGRLAMPGLVNGHTHAAMTLFRGAAEGDPAGWFNDQIWVMESNLRPGDVALGTELAVAEMLLAGVTSFADMYFQMEEAAEVVERTGIRAQLSEGFFSDAGDAARSRSIDFARSWDGRADGRIRTAIAPHAPYTCTAADLTLAADAAREAGLPIHTHAAETPQQTASMLEREGLTPVQRLQETGVLDVGGIIAHGKGIVAADLPLLGAAGRVAVTTCPKGYLKHNWDVTPIPGLNAVGVPVGLGTDGCGSNNTLDVWESVRFTQLVHQAHGGWEWATAARMLHHATVQSAATAWLHAGVLEPGRLADVVLVDLDQPHLQPVHDLATTLTLSLRASDVVTTVVAGRVLVHERELRTIDSAAVMARAAARAPELADISHGRRVQTYAP